MRSVLYRFPDLRHFERVVSDAAEADFELGLPPGEAVEDGEWVLAIFELGAGRRATSAAARATTAPEGPRLTFEPRDWSRLARFAEVEAERPGSMPDIADPPSDADESAPTERSAGTTGPSGRAPTTPPARTRPRGAGARILVIDDDPDIRDVVSAMLEAVELVVATVTSAEDALQRVRAERFDLLVLDWNLPKMTGLELCHLLRRDPVLRDIPVLFLTANASSQDMVDAFASGADDYVVKPFRAPELGARVFSLLRRTRRDAI